MNVSTIRTLKQQGIEQKPTIKIGWKASAMERRGIATDKGDLNREITADNQQLRDLQIEFAALTEAKTEIENIKEQAKGMQDFKAEYELFKQEQQQQKLDTSGTRKNPRKAAGQRH